MHSIVSPWLSIFGQRGWSPLSLSISAVVSAGVLPVFMPTQNTLPH